jgi:DNA-binding transcriptional regulator YiaG
MALGIKGQEPDNNRHLNRRGRILFVGRRAASNTVGLNSAAGTEMARLYTGLGLNQGEFAALISHELDVDHTVDVRTLRRWEKGDAKPSHEVAVAIEHVLRAGFRQRSSELGDRNADDTRWLPRGSLVSQWWPLPAGVMTGNFPEIELELDDGLVQSSLYWLRDKATNRKVLVRLVVVACLAPLAISFAMASSHRATTTASGTLPTVTTVTAGPSSSAITKASTSGDVASTPLPTVPSSTLQEPSGIAPPIPSAVTYATAPSSSVVPPAVTEPVTTRASTTQATPTTSTVPSTQPSTATTTTTTQPTTTQPATTTTVAFKLKPFDIDEYCRAREGTSYSAFYPANDGNAPAYRWQCKSGASLVGIGWGFWGWCTSKTGGVTVITNFDDKYGWACAPGPGLPIDRDDLCRQTYGSSARNVVQSQADSGDQVPAYRNTCYVGAVKQPTGGDSDNWCAAKTGQRYNGPINILTDPNWGCAAPAKG